MAATGTVTLESSDGKQFPVQKNVAEMLITVKHMLSEIQTDAAIPLSNVKSAVLGKVLEWCDYHSKNPDPPVPESEKYRLDNIKEWDKNFMKVDLELLFDIVLAANYLDVKGLLDLGCKTIALHMKDKTVDEIKEAFKIPEKK